MLFIDISSPFAVIMGGKKGWLLVHGDINHAWSYFLKVKSKLKDVMMVLLKDLNVMPGTNIKHIH